MKDWFIDKTFGLSKLHKLLKQKIIISGYNDKVNNLFPDFRTFKNNVQGNQRMFSIEDGIDILQNHLKECQMLIPKEELLNLIYPDYDFQTRRYSLNKLIKALKAINTEDYLKGKSFPDFKQFKDSFTGDLKEFSINDGLKILNSYSKGSIYNINGLEIHQMRILKAKKQNKRFIIKDNNGLLA